VTAVRKIKTKRSVTVIERPVKRRKAAKTPVSLTVSFIILAIVLILAGIYIFNNDPGMPESLHPAFLCLL
jgi:hypothetical protein